MKRTALLLLFACSILSRQRLSAQEADAGIDLRATLSGQVAASNDFTEAPVSAAPVGEGFRAVFYPTWKLSDHWTVSGAWQLYSHPYFFSSFDAPGYGAKGNIIQASLNYSRVSQKGSLLIRAGELSTAFGSFLLRYDDADNPLVDLPLAYGYYYSPISNLPVAGAQIDATRGKWDGRAQFANSSPANPRSIFQHDQYGNWAGGGGYTIRQGLRVGVSAYRGPYLDRQYAYFFPGEANPNTLQAHAFGTDVQWTHGHWNLQGEFQHFVLPYRAIPTFIEDAGYVEVKRALGPRWYAAVRAGYSSGSEGGNTERYEFAAGLRPDRFQLLKADFEFDHYSAASDPSDKIFAVQFVTTFNLAHAAR